MPYDAEASNGAMEQRAAIKLEVNGEEREFHGPADTPLLWALRDAFGLKGVKYGCGTGACGSCMVLVEGEPRHSCTLSVADAAGKRVLTIEALAREPQRPLVQAWVAEQVPQCGYCQPAQLVTAHWLLERHPQPSDTQIDDAMSYVLCRCGTYPRIRRAIHRAASWSAAEPRQRTEALAALPAGPAHAGVMLNPWLRINRDGSVTLLVDRAEMGQGAITGLAMLAAEELEIDLERLHVEFAPAAPEYANPLIGVQLTGGSTSIRAAWDSLRLASAEARERLISVAAASWKVRRSECRAQAGAIVHEASGRRAPYAALAAAAAARRAPRGVKPKRPHEFRLIGRSTPRLEVPDLALGRAVFALDVTWPSPLEAVLVRCPSFGGRVASFDPTKALRIPGVVDVREVAGALAVVAESVPAALAGRDAVHIHWDLSSACRLDSDAIRERLGAALEQPGATARERGNVERGLARAKQVVEARYETPYLAHAALEPLSCIAQVTGDGCDIWAGTQAQTRAQAIAMEITGLPREQVRVHSTYLGGAFGRRLEVDYVAEAVRLAKMLRRSVRVVWTRADDLQHDFYRPASVTALRAGLDARGHVCAWLQRIAGPELGLGEVDIPYAIHNLREVHIEEDPGVPTGPWRSVGASQNAFAVECFVDELAAAAGRDPLEFRLAALKHAPRHRAVLKLAADEADWHLRMSKGRGCGIAVYHSYGSWVAQVAEVSRQESGFKVERIVCAIDCGTVVNPDAVKAQVEGAIVFGLSAALHGEITLRDGAVQQSGFQDYPILRLRDTPEIEVHLVPSHAHPGGVGEPGVPPVAPAVANALFAATGERLRRLPLVR
jgi:isoquinoline 1-oxidoreductase beta subunit